MARVTVEDCLPVVDNRFALVHLTVKRARQLMSGARPIVDSTRDKPPVVSLREIATTKVRFDRNVKEVLSGKFTVPKGETKLVPAGSRNPPPSAPSGGIF